MFKYEGIFSFYKGIKISLIAFVPKNTLCFTSTNFFKKNYEFSKNSSINVGIAGAISG